MMHSLVLGAQVFMRKFELEVHISFPNVNELSEKNLDLKLYGMPHDVCDVVLELSRAASEKKNFYLKHYGVHHAVSEKNLGCL
jgi:hypothetical protein